MTREKERPMPEPTPVPDAAEVPKKALEALADADRAWTEALDSGGNVGDPDELRLTSLLAFGDERGVFIDRASLTLTPAPGEGLTEEERRLVEEWKSYYPDPPTGVTNANHVCHLIAIIDRLTASPAPLPDDEER